MNTKNLKIAGYYERPNGRWYVTEDRAWKVRINDENDATAIYKSHEVYRLILGDVYNVRDRISLSPKVHTHQEVTALVAEVRSIKN